MRSKLFCCLALCLVACGSPGEPTEGGVHPGTDGGTPVAEDQLDVPWTPSFTRGAVLIADEVWVEGPKGLLNHFAARVVEPHHRQSVETIPAGFQQIVEVVNLDAGVEIRSILDSMQIVAVKRLTVLERPGDVRVKIRATGRVYYKRDGQDAIERPSIELMGAEPK